MNLEAHPPELQSQLDDERLREPYHPARSAERQPSSRAASNPNGSDSEVAALAKAPTLMIGATDDQAGAVRPEQAAPVPMKYIQGIVQGGRAFIITNLIQAQSQTLFQPQMVWTIGRNREAALPLQDRAMSRRHAVILYVPDIGFQLIDLNSMNGSFVNSERLRQRCVLQDGDRLRLGNTDFTFFISQRRRAIDAVHPEVLARFTASKSRPDDSIDFSAEEPEILFKSTRTNL